jgi:hypothetical protein
MWIMLGWIARSWGLDKNQPHLPNYGAKILIGTGHFSNQYPAHPFHHVLVLVCPEDDN